MRAVRATGASGVMETGGRGQRQMTVTEQPQCTA